MAEDLNTCEHPECTRIAVRMVGPEAPYHRDFRGDMHDCCGRHARPAKQQPQRTKEDLLAQLLGDVSRLKGQSLRSTLVEYGVTVVSQ